MLTAIKSKREFFAPQPATPVQAQRRRTSDKILAAFDHACEQDDLEVAALLLVEYERVVTREPTAIGKVRRREMESLISAHSRLWELLRSNAAE